MSVMQRLQKAIDVVTKAVEEDVNCNYEDALMLYEYGAESLHNVMENEGMSESVKKVGNEKSSMYLGRAKQIREYLESAEEPVKSGESNSNEYELEGAVAEGIPCVKLSDVAGLEGAKKYLKEEVVFPIRFPDLFPEKRIPTKGILLFGPPGTGKSHLARAIAKEAVKAKFFLVSASYMGCKCVAESERLVKNVFELARQCKPTILFFEEVDILCPSSSDKESESARRMRAEFLFQMHGVGNDNDGILVLGATNIPLVLDSAILEVFEKRIYIPLPDEEARLKIFKQHLRKTSHTLTEEDFEVLANKTKGYSGADIKTVVQDALIRQSRRVETATHFQSYFGPSPVDPNVIVDGLLTPCSPGSPGAIAMKWMDVPSDQLFVPPLTMNDMLRSLADSKSTLKMMCRSLKSLTKNLARKFSCCF